jgi:aspartate aminotransferase
MIAERVLGISESPTLRISAMAAGLRAEGVDVLDFSAGQPDFHTPDAVKEAGRRAIDENRTGYTANVGLIELRESIRARLRQVSGIDYAASQVIVSPGAKASLYFACLSLINPGDEVLVPRPYWVTYPEQVRLAQGVPVYADCPQSLGFKLTADEIERVATPRTRVLLLNYPSNPTGACYTREDLEPIARVCTERDIWIVADEIYSRLLYDGRRFSSVAAAGHGAAERTVVIDGMSKTYAMTGWRIGYAAGPEEVIRGMAKLQSHVTSNATSIAQWASVAALALDDEVLDARTREFERRRNRLMELLDAIPGVRCPVPEGAFYAFPNVSGLFDASRGLTCGGDVAEFLLREARVAVVPGEAFGSPEHIRISYATSLERIEEGVARIARALGRG